MIVRVLCEWEEVGDDEYKYVEWIEVEIKSDDIQFVKYYVNKKVLRSLFERGLSISKLKEIEREYVGSKELEGL
jgi:hypothetical protein